MDTAERDRLLDLLIDKSFMYSENAEFKLASGKMSKYYVNCKKTAYHPEGINLVGRAVYELAAKHAPDGVGGLTLGADPLAVAAAGESFKQGNPFKAFVVRKQVKEHGTRLPVEGDMHAGERVVILEDVITTGGSALTAIKAAREFGLVVAGVVALVDRQEGGRENIEAEGAPVDAVFTIEDIMERYRAAGGK